ncbi:MAG: class beta-lactamase-related serine hydrolase [Chlamydiia bacterium]|nr:class beta-lactamase-related serine hydrolase [Chlamydiia bacterium]
MQPYLPPYFIQQDRLSRVQAVLPQIDALYRECAEKNHIPGFAYGIIVDGKLIHTGYSGIANLEKKTPVTAQSMFRIASMTKSFTALSILKLRDENKLRLDDPISLYFPEMKGQKLIDDVPVSTIRDLLTHAAGFPTDDPWADRKLHETEKELIALVKRGLYFSTIPGTTYEYSNLGYTLLGSIIQKVTGVPYEKFILEQICQPIGMKDIAWEFTEVEPSQLAQGYRWHNEAWKKEEMLHDGIFGAMGGMITSIESFSQYVALHLSAWPPRTDLDVGPVKRCSIREMQQPLRFDELLINKDTEGNERIVTSAYGYGLKWSKDMKGRVTVGHSGGLPGFGSNWLIMPEYGVGIVGFANVTYAPVTKLHQEILEKIVTVAELQPRQLPASNILKERQRELVQLLPDWNRAENSGIFAHNFFLDYSIVSLKKEASELFAKAGEIIKTNEMVPENQLAGHFVLECEKTDLRVRFALTPEHIPLIQEYKIEEIKKP